MKSIAPLPLKVKYSGFTPAPIFSAEQYSVRVLQGFISISATVFSPSDTRITPSAFPQTSTTILSAPSNAKYLNPDVAPLQKFDIYWSGLPSLSAPLCVKYGWQPFEDLKIPP